MRRKSIKRRLITGFGSLSLMAVLVGTIQLNSVNQLSSTASHISQNIVVGMASANKIATALHGLELNIQKLQTNGANPSALEETGLYLTENREEFEKYLGLYKSGKISDREVKLTSDIEKGFRTYKGCFCKNPPTWKVSPTVLISIFVHYKKSVLSEVRCVKMRLELT